MVTLCITERQDARRWFVFGSSASGRCRIDSRVQRRQSGESDHGGRQRPAMLWPAGAHGCNRAIDSVVADDRAGSNRQQSTQQTRAKKHGHGCQNPGTLDRVDEHESSQGKPQLAGYVECLVTELACVAWLLRVRQPRIRATSCLQRWSGTGGARSRVQQVDVLSLTSAEWSMMPDTAGGQQHLHSAARC